VDFTLNNGQSGTGINLTTENSGRSAFPLLGLVVGRDSTSSDIVPGSFNYFYLDDVSLPGTPPNSIPQSVPSYFSTSTGLDKQAETAVWTIAVTGVTGTLSPEWVNTDESTPTTQVFVQSNHVYAGGDAGAFHDRFPAPVTVVTLHLEIREARPVDACVSPPVLDNFNRANGSVGNNWRGLTGASFYRIAENRLDVQVGGPIYWNPSPFGTSQAASVRLSTIDPKSPSQGVLLKVQTGSVPNAGAIAVVYDAAVKAVRVSTLRLGTLSWKPYGNTPTPFATGDKLGACAKANGEVRIYKNDTLVKTVTLTAADQGFFNPKGGKVGVWTLGAPLAFLDDFGGATITP
jgi:hypothetical protein